MELLNTTVLICSCITGISAAVAVFVSLFRKASEPNRGIMKRLEAVEDKLVRHDELFASDNKRLKSIEDGNRVTQKSILALLSHGIDGNDIQAMKDAKEELQTYLLNK